MSYIFSVDGNYVNFNGGGNMHRLHSDSNCIAWHFDQTGDLFFDVYDQEYVVKAENIATVVIDGVPLSAASDFPDAIIAIFPGLGGGGGGTSYLVYAANISQTGTGAPTAANEFNNGAGTVSYTYDGVGQYSVLGTFPMGKTFALLTLAGGTPAFLNAEQFEANMISITTFNSTESLGNGKLQNAVLMIFVTP